MVTIRSMALGTNRHAVASAGYHRAPAAYQAPRQSREDRLTAAEQQDQALRRHREPKSAFADARALTEQLQARARAATDPEAELGPVPERRRPATRSPPRAPRRGPKPDEGRMAMRPPRPRLGRLLSAGR